MGQKVRYHYLDWLRISAFLLLILYHSGRAFFPEDPWHINDEHGSWALRIFMDLIARWRLPLLFFISGVGTWFVLSRRDVSGFLKNRFSRLLIPLLFAMAVIVPPQVWLERTFKGQTQLGYFSWYVQDAFTKGTYSSGNISWHHLWYIAYLLVMTLILLPVLFAYQRGKLGWLRRAIGKICSGPQLLLMVLFPLFVANTMMRIWPDKTMGLLDDWGWLSLTASWFLIGFMVTPHIDVLTKTARRFGWLSGGLWLMMTLGILFLPGSDDLKFDVFGYHVKYDDAFTIPIAWMAIITLVGLFSTLFNKDSKAKRYLNTAVYPLYIIHQTIALALVFVVVPLDWNVWSKFAVVGVGTFTIGFGIHHFVLLRLGPLRTLFGINR
ncbi:MAG TPA: hypothetical protein ENJ55_03195 [Rhizobiales bacterium]|nr:hypothetical protein [Hyphomicrobiales bacterium]